MGGPPVPPGPPGGAPPPAPLPWEARGELGFFAALIETVKLFVFTPSEAYARAYRTGDLASPILYAVIVGWAASLVAMLWQLLFQGVPALSQMGMGADEAGLAFLGSAAFLVGMALFMPLIIVIGLFIWGAIFHLSLMLVGGLEHSETDFEGTLRTLSYAGTSNLAQVLPLVGGLIAFGWQVVLATIGASRLHRTTQGKALLAVLLPLLLCCVCIIVGVMLAIGAGIGAGSGLFDSLE